MIPFLPLIAAIGGSLISSLIGNAGAQSRQDAMNAYNAPAAQMARYSAAGLNPNLIYSQGTPGNQTSATPFMTPEVDPIKIYSAAQEVRESKERIALAHARTQAQALRNMYDSLRLQEQSKYYAENARYQSSIMKHTVQNILTRTGNLDQVYANLIKDAAIKDQILNERAYYNRLRGSGIEKGDNPFYRMGALVFQKYFPKINQKLFRP